MTIHGAKNIKIIKFCFEEVPGCNDDWSACYPCDFSHLFQPASVVLCFVYSVTHGPDSVVGIAHRSYMTYNDWLRAGRSGDRIPVGTRFSAPVQTGPRAHPASCTMGTRSFPGVNSGRGVTLIPHPLLVPWSWKCRAIPLLPPWVVQPVQSLSACTRVHFTFHSVTK
jgi:hypothetical protein